MKKATWSKQWVEALVMLPSYLTMAVLVTKLDLILWLLAWLLAQYAFGKAYALLVIENRLFDSQMPRKRVAMTLFTVQIFILCSGLWLSAA